MSDYRDMSRNKSEETKVTKCAACVINEGDYTAKSCKYCTFCGEWLCSKAFSSPKSHLKKLAMQKKGMDIDTYMKEMKKWYNS
jgi:hypothetical protein